MPGIPKQLMADPEQMCCVHHRSSEGTVFFTVIMNNFVEELVLAMLQEVSDARENNTCSWFWR